MHQCDGCFAAFNFEGSLEELPALGLA
jgi:hypothetical protein